MRSLALSLFLFLPLAAPAVEPFRLQPGDRVVLLGSTLVEREQKYGYWEAALTARFPGVTFRNLGWSGDTVRGVARASFDFPKPEVPFGRLVNGTLSLKPTVILVAYGTNESFEGPAGLPTFVADLEKLLNALAPAKARVVLFGPPRHEDVGRPLPDPTAQNRNLRLYGDAIRAIAQKHGHRFVDLYDLFAEASRASGPLTDNGMHLTAFGYWRTAFALEKGLGLEPLRPRVEIDAAAKETRVALRELPRSPAPSERPARAALPETGLVVTAKGLPMGRYQLRIDGQSVLTADAATWAAGVNLTQGPDVEQAERLRAKIVEKNREYFHRWRPQNETYLFGFRKHEQGQNAREVPLFEPLVEKLEKEIAQLRVPATRRYELVPQ